MIEQKPHDHEDDEISGFSDFEDLQEMLLDDMQEPVNNLRQDSHLIKAEDLQKLLDEEEDDFNDFSDAALQSLLDSS